MIGALQIGCKKRALVLRLLQFLQLLCFHTSILCFARLFEMDWEAATSEEVSEVLEENNIHQATIECLRGELAHAFAVIIPQNVPRLENAIDGFALLQLVGDLEEFKQLVPQAGIRLKIKSIIRKVCPNSASLAEATCTMLLWTFVEFSQQFTALLTEPRTSFTIWSYGYVCMSLNLFNL